MQQQLMKPPVVRHKPKAKAKPPQKPKVIGVGTKKPYKPPNWLYKLSTTLLVKCSDCLETFSENYMFCPFCGYRIFKK